MLVISTNHPFDMLEKTIKKISPPTFKLNLPFIYKSDLAGKKNPVDHAIPSPLALIVSKPIPTNCATCSSRSRLDAEPAELEASGRGSGFISNMSWGQRRSQFFFGKKKFKKKTGWIHRKWLASAKLRQPFPRCSDLKKGKLDQRKSKHRSNFGMGWLVWRDHGDVIFQHRCLSLIVIQCNTHMCFFRLT